MIYPHQQAAIDHITQKLQADAQILALLITGSIAHGYNDARSDVDINILISQDAYEQKSAAKALTYFENAAEFYEGGYFDGKFITLDFLSQVAKNGNEPSRFALYDARIAFDRTGQVPGLLEQIAVYPTQNIENNTLRFLSQLEAWHWYCGQAAAKNDPYLMDTSVTKLILFAGRLILLENKMFFPYHKWLMRALEGAPLKPQGLIPAIQNLLREKTLDNAAILYHLVKDYKDWTQGASFSWSAHFLHDIETLWLRQDEFIENV